MIKDIQNIDERTKQCNKSIITEYAQQVIHIQPTNHINTSTQSAINHIITISFEEYLSYQNNPDVTTYLAVIKTTNVQQTDDTFSQQLQSYVLE